MKKAFALALGFLLSLALLELGLRLSGLIAPRPTGPDAEFLSHPVRILVLGNSYTQGVGAPSGESYSDHLRRMLEERYPGRTAVLNRGTGNVNSRQILAALPSQLEKLRPTIVVAMAGQPNAWNPFGYYSYLREAKLAAGGRGWLYRLHDALYPIRVVRFVFTLSDAIAKHEEAREPKSIVFPHVPLRERDSLAVSWISLTQWTKFNNLTPAEAAEGERSLIDYEAVHPLNVTGYVALARLALAHSHDRKAAVAWLRKALAQARGHFRVPLHKYFSNPRVQAEFAGEPGFAELAAAAEKGEPNGVARKQLLDWFTQARLPFDESKPGGLKKNLAFLESAVLMEPDDPFSYFQLGMDLSRRQNDFVKAAYWIQKGIENAPGQTRYSLFNMLFAAGQASPQLRKQTDDFAARFRANYPALAWNANFVFPEDELPWVKFDLQRMYQETHARGIPLVLQTYPPHRHSDEPWRADSAIREVASETGSPLNDVSAGLNAYFSANGPKERYYSFFGGAEDEHLNGEGYRIVAQLLLETLQANKLVP